jgi:ketosteroid isomerase-like protein
MNTGQIFVATLLASTMGVGAALTSDRPADREAIRRHIERIFQAYQSRDRTTVRQTHAENWRGFIRPSRQVIRGLDQYMKEAEVFLGGPFRLVGHRMVEFDVIFYGETALVSYVADIEVERNGVRFPDKLRVVDVYARQKGEWNQVGSNVAQHPDAQEAFRQMARPLSPAEKAELLETRESVWRAWYANDRARLERLLPEEAVAINPNDPNWADRKGIFEGAQQFAGGGGKLLRLEFPRTEIQAYGDIAILYTTFLVEVEVAGKPAVQSGRGTELFVRRNGTWVNSGWHLDSGK